MMKPEIKLWSGYDDIKLPSNGIRTVNGCMVDEGYYKSAFFKYVQSSDEQIGYHFWIW